MKGKTANKSVQARAGYASVAIGRIRPAVPDRDLGRVVHYQGLTPFFRSIVGKFSPARRLAVADLWVSDDVAAHRFLVHSAQMHTPPPSEARELNSPNGSGR